MRQLLTLVLSSCFLTAFGQANLLTGSYSDTLANHKIILSLHDNEEFRSEEILTEGRRILFGTWAFQDNIITLRTTKIFAWEWKTPKEKKEFFPKDFPDILISVDRNSQLTILPPKNTEGLATRLEKLKTKLR